MALSSQTMQWLDAWLYGGLAEELPPLTVNVERELAPYRPLTNVTLYRAELDYPMETETALMDYDEPTSWSYSREVVTWLSERDYFPILKATFHPDDVLVDTTRLPAAVMRHFNSEQEEVLILPGVYQATALGR